MTDKDRADLDRAGHLIAEGKVIRRQVFARLRARAHRGTKAAKENTGENSPAIPQKS